MKFSLNGTSGITIKQFNHLSGAVVYLEKKYGKNFILKYNQHNSNNEMLVWYDVHSGGHKRAEIQFVY